MTINPRVQGWYLDIEGVPSRIGYGRLPDDDDREGVTTLVSTGGQSSDSIDIISGSFSASAVSFEVSATDDMRRLFLYQQVVPVGSIVDDQGSTVELSPDPGYSVGQIIYAGAEALEIASVDGGGAYGVDRAVLDTFQDNQENQPFYDRVPRWRGRKIELYIFDGQSSDRRWLGYISETRTNDDGTRIVLPCENIWTALFGTSLPRRTPRDFQSYFELAGENRLVGFADVGTAFIQVAGGLLQESFASGTVAQGDRTRSLLGSDIDLSDSRTVEISGAVTRVFPSDIYPIFLAGRATDDELGVIDGDTLEPVPGGQFSPQAAFPYHPLTSAVFIITGLVLDESDNFVTTSSVRGARNFSLLAERLFPDSFFEQAATLIKRTAELEMDHFVLGWDGEQFDPISVIQNQLLRPYGFSFGVAQDGGPIIVEVGIPTVEQAIEVELNDRYVSALPSPFVGRFSLSQASSQSVVSAEVGDLPWGDGVQIDATIVGGDANRTRLNDRGAFTLDYSTLSASRRDEIANEIISLSALATFSLPELSVRAPNAEAAFQYDLGELVRLVSLPTKGEFLISPSGELVEDLVGEDWYGVIVERSFDQFAQNYALRIKLTSYHTGLSRLRAPAAIVAESDRVGGDIYRLVLVDPFGFVGDIADSFRPGGFVYFLNDSLSLQHAPTPAPEIFDFLADQVIDVDSPYEPVPGDIIRLAGYSENATETVVEGFQIWNYIADASTARLPGDDNPAIYS